MSNCIITIPIYKSRPNTVEIASFKQCLKTLSSHNICIVTHKNLNIAIYKMIANDYSVKLHIKYFDESYFQSVQGYNQLCLNTSFYHSFINYEYLLIYQLDAWVFKDELDYWCSKGYDYIGAPFFDTKEYNTNNMIGIGNGGFSLRKTRYCINFLNSKDWIPFLRPLYLWNFYFHKKETKNSSKSTLQLLFIFIKYILSIFGYQNSLKYLKKHRNEDYILSEYAINSWNKIKPHMPSNEEASLFAYEINPSYLLSQTKSLPFGCHGFEKYEFNTFWKKYIKIDKNV